MSAATWPELYAAARSRLGSDSEARWLVEEASGEQFPVEGSVPERPGRRFAAMLERRAGGEPLQYVLGRWGFRHLDLMVDQRVLIPRPETEVVVEVALAELSATPGQVAVDLGTGSGAIGLSLVAEHPRVEVWATDSSPDALDVARANAAGLGGRAASRIRFAEGEWWTALPPALKGRVDLAVANPPYLAAAEHAHLDPVVRDWEPVRALVAGPAGLEAVEAILSGAPDWLAPGGTVVVEIAPHQAAPLRTAFPGAEVHPDLAGRDRVLVARFPSLGRRTPPSPQPGPS